MSSFILVGWNPTPRDGRWEVYELSERHPAKSHLRQFERESKLETLQAVEEGAHVDLGYFSRTQAGRPSTHRFDPSSVNSGLRARGEIFGRQAMVVWHSAGRWNYSHSAPTNQPMPIRTPAGSENNKRDAIDEAFMMAQREDLLGVLFFDTDNRPHGFKPDLPVWNHIAHEKMTRRNSVSPLRYENPRFR